MKPAQQKTPLPKPVPETVILECQHRVYELIDEATKKKGLVAMAQAELTKVQNDFDYSIRKVQEMIDFLADQDDEESSDTRGELEASAAHKGLDVKRKEAASA